MSTNRVLGIAAVVLFVLSAWTYRESVQRAERFERGQKFLPNLNPDEIAEILITRGEESTHLERREDHFVVVGANGYPARNESVNRLVNDVLGVSLEKEIGAGEELNRELGLTAGHEDTTEVTFKDGAGKEMVRILVGKAKEDGGGNYVRRADAGKGTVYLTTSRAYLNAGDDSFLKKELVNVQQSEIVAIHGPDFTLEERDGSLELADPPRGGEENRANLGQLKSILSGLRFDKHYLADDPAVAGLRFGPPLLIDLDDQSGYELSVASKDDKHYLKIRAFHSVQRLEIAPEDSEEEVREKSEILARAEEVRKFNDFHGSWIYEVGKTTADRVAFRKRDLLEADG